MAMFFSFPVQAPSAYSPTTAAWHNEHPILAVAAREQQHDEDTGVVNLFTDDGEHIDDGTLQRVAQPSVIAWHPTQRLLAVGWDTGEIVLWNVQTLVAHEAKSLHDSDIRFLKWSADGTKLISGDDTGRIGVWKTAKNGRPTLNMEFRLSSPVTHCEIRDDNNPSAAAADQAGLGPFMFYVACANRKVYLCTHSGQHEEAFSSDIEVQSMMYNPPSEMLVIITKSNMMHQLTSSSNGSLGDDREFKLSSRLPMQVVWAGPGVLVAATGENMLRVWDLDLEDNYSLSLGREKGEFPVGDSLISVSYDARTRVLAAGSSAGFTYMWGSVSGKGALVHKLEGSDRWAFQASPSELGGSLHTVAWGGGRSLLCACGGDKVSILREQIMRKGFGGGTAAVQVSSGRLLVEVFKKSCLEVDTDFSIKGIAAKGEYVVAWGSRSAAVFELVRDSSIIRPAGTFKCEGIGAAALHGQTVYTAEGTKVEARNPQGALKQSLALQDSQGEVTSLDCNGNFLVAGTSLGVLLLWDLTRREARQAGSPRFVTDRVEDVQDVRVNSNGSRVSFIGCGTGSSDPSLWVWDVESDQVYQKDFGLLTPRTHLWDSTEPKLLVCELTGETVVSEDGSADTAPMQIASLFVTSNDGILVQQQFALAADSGPLLGVQVPYLFFTKRTRAKASDTIMAAQPMRDFVGMEDADKETAAAMLSFSYHLTVGQMDEAFKAVRAIQSEAVWDNMARMCVSTKRLDVASVCMGNMGNALGARALREAEKEPELEARVGALATALGMYDEAEALYKECGRHDLLNRLCQDRGLWERALQVARTKDRVHLRNTHYNYAKHLEAQGQYMAAAENYQKSDTHRFEVPRMLFDDASVLESYIKRSQDKGLIKWWGQYCESKGDVDAALQQYQAADDVLAQVQLHCYSDDVVGFEKAKSLVDSSNNRAAAYHLARQYENDGDFENAVKYFSQSECFRNAIRIAKENGLKGEMYSMALRSSKSDMVEAAQHYEGVNGQVDKAVTLYHRAGRVTKALDLCFKHNLYQALADISVDLNEDADPELMQRAATFFMEARQYDKAVSLLLTASKYEEAVDMCMEHSVVITDEMAERMTLEKTSDRSHNERRSQLLEKVADCCALQGSYQLATKKYTQAGNKLKAMRSLLKSGDTEQIIFYATKCRQKEIFIMAANYLQSLDWRRDSEIMKHIINFYTKGKALDSLSSFYDACAQVEIDDFQNYDKALGALNEALKYISKAKMKDFDQQEARVSGLQQRIELVKRFCDIRRIAEADPSEMVVQATQLLQEPDVENAVRIGDVYGLMIEYIASTDDFQRAYELMQEMRNKIPNVNMAYYVNMRTIEAVHRALDIPLGRGHGAEDDESGEEIDEDVADED
eukprot:m.483017 g.483017  ORF g.483017 m.483017 type:complete len:1380 (-) comp22745_c0_seq1:34-4173(-)